MKLETAQALRDLGFIKPVLDFDDLYYSSWREGLDVITSDAGQHLGDTPAYLWIPRLDQLLAEIERRGWAWRLDMFPPKAVYRLALYEAWDRKRHFDADSPEEAAASALLWILKEAAHE